MTDDMHFKVESESKNATRVDVSARNFEFTIDEPENSGGNNDGPTPVEFELGALTGCLNVVGHLVAKEKEIQLEDMTITAEGELNPEKYLGKPSDDRAGFKEIDVQISVETDAEEEALQEWAEEVERRCPVSDNLNHETPMNINFDK